jgi:tRNA(adenine34) deaminase
MTMRGATPDNDVTMIATVDQTAIDAAMMQRCIELSATATQYGEFPFASIICLGSKMVVEEMNRVKRDHDVTQHAELLAISKAQQVLGRKDLSRCTLYSNVEPCVMCSFPIRETRIARVVFAIRSPMMGGASKWNVLRDVEISNVMPEAFGPVPETIEGLLWREAEKVWRDWNPIVWAVIKHRGCLSLAHDDYEHRQAIPLQVGFMHRMMMQYLNRHSI